MQKTITVSKAMWAAAEAVVNMGKEVGLELKIGDVYTKDTSKELALIANFLIQQVKKAGNCEVKIVKD